ncbi:hypothetical protein CLU79DRAFT_691955 [Phycomyces nitens]|nr:hypothetical protein CLU79DRAFT_691955 [Phycomyces nitens]
MLCKSIFQQYYCCKNSVKHGLLFILLYIVVIKPLSYGSAVTELHIHLNSLPSCLSRSLRNINKLPDEGTKEHTIEEQELIVNYIGPIFSPLLHNNGNNKLFIW